MRLKCLSVSERLPTVLGSLIRFLAGQNYKGTVVAHSRLERPLWVQVV